ncbi:MAG: hypothetical protein PHV28_01380 [Kiritimatiellae bacterium]|nr:hypothetical protein [Kiritimatiellia bacterium]
MRNHVRFLVAVATCMVSSQVFGIHAYWIGGTSGSWSEKANWSGNAVPNTANYFVHITNEVPVTISADSATVGRIAFSGANHTIPSGTISFGAAESPGRSLRRTSPISRTGT